MGECDNMSCDAKKCQSTSNMIAARRGAILDTMQRHSLALKVSFFWWQTENEHENDSAWQTENEHENESACNAPSLAGFRQLRVTNCVGGLPQLFYQQ